MIYIEPIETGNEKMLDRVNQDLERFQLSIESHDDKVNSVSREEKLDDFSERLNNGCEYCRGFLENYRADDEKNAIDFYTYSVEESEKTLARIAKQRIQRFDDAVINDFYDDGETIELYYRLNL